MRSIRFGTGSLAALLLLWLMTEPALAAPPVNDIAAGATLAQIGLRETINTSEATTDLDDAQLNSLCGAPATDASVWYAIQGAGQGVVVDVSASRYSAGVLVGVGTPGSLQFVNCSMRKVAFTAQAGLTYYVIVIDDQNDGGGNGGSMTVSFEEIPPPPKLSLTVDPTGTVDIKTGVATLTGTFSCVNGDAIVGYVDARQNVGRFTVFGSGIFMQADACDGKLHPWAASVVPANGKFAGGKSMGVTFATSCGVSTCGEGYVEQIVQLHGGRK
jgi:hypothetical protein